MEKNKFLTMQLNSRLMRRTELRTKVCIGAEKISEIFEWIGTNNPSKYQPGSRTHLRIMKAIAFLTVKYIHSPFLGTFSLNFSTYVNLCRYITKYICLTSLMRAKPKDKMEFPT